MLCWPNFAWLCDRTTIRHDLGTFYDPATVGLDGHFTYPHGNKNPHRGTLFFLTQPYLT